ncbi:MAG TPA: Trm112 family protein [Nitrososphaeraceae archaeon]|jgi:uncharacterized protein YbaR (Trm112 family)|nr:Trm112 family protein [Nitrososphaeraceae archaeon]
MRKRLLDILACPIDKFYPLELYEFNTRKENDSNQEKEEVIIGEGILYCIKCKRFFPIIDEIPIMLPDELRERDKDLKFLQKWQDRIPDSIINDPRPY